MKICTKCEEEKELKEFSWKDKSIGLKHTRCKICVRQSIKKHYIANKEKYKKKAIANSKTYSKRNQEFIINYLKEHPCVICGEADIVVLEFDHISGKKEITLCKLLQKAGSVSKIQEEIDKCQILCANCHRRKTAVERSYYKLSI